MPGIGPAPKDPGRRRRRNEPARGEWTELAPLAEPVLPELSPLDDEDWSPGTRAMWDAWRVDPVTAQWSPADIAFAIDTIYLHQRMTPSTANEIRLRMDALGLTPKGKRDLRWKITAETRQAEVKPMPQPRRLRAV